MVTPHTILVAKYSGAASNTYVQAYFIVTLIVSGLRYLRIEGAELRNPGPIILAQAEGMIVEYEYNDPRENWLVQVDTPSARPGVRKGTVEIEYEGTWTPIPSVTKLPVEKVVGWKMEFMRMLEAFKTPLPTNRLRVALGFTNVLRNIIDSRCDRLATTPAQELKVLIDQGLAATFTLEELSRRCGYSPDHLRRMFRKEYGTTPLAYFNQSRMAEAMGLLANTSLTVKEIAYKTGFRHVSHFSAMFRKTFNESPSEAISKLRLR